MSASPGSRICFFWLFTAIFARQVAPFDPLAQVPIMKDALPGAIDPMSAASICSAATSSPATSSAAWSIGSQIVLIIAPAATAFALMVGITLGLPAGYHGGRVDSFLSFLANLVLAFPVILLFYLLVTPGIMDTPIPYGLAGLFFLFPIIFFATLFYTRFKNRPQLLAVQLGADADHRRLDLCRSGLQRRPVRHHLDRAQPAQHLRRRRLRIEPGRVPHRARPDDGHQDARLCGRGADPRRNAPGTSCCGRSCPTRAGPLIVDACLRIGYTTILLGTLGYFGLGLAPESPDWGTAIKDASRLLRSFIHPALPPAFALMCFVLGLNLLADALREQSMKD